MSIEKLTLVNIVGKMDSLDDTILRCLEREDFHPERSLDYTGQIRGFGPLESENPYAGLLKDLTNIGMQAGFSPQNRPRVKPAGNGRLWARNKYCTDFCHTLQKDIGLLREQRNNLQSEIEQDEAALNLLSHINALDIDVDSLFSCQYIKIRVGRLPVDSYMKLGLYASRMFLFVPMDKEKIIIGALFLPRWNMLRKRMICCPPFILSGYGYRILSTGLRKKPWNKSKQI